MDIKFNDCMMFIYHNRTEIARHKVLPKHMRNAISTDEKHLPMPLRQDITPDMVRDRAREIGSQTFEVIRRMFERQR